MKSYFIIIALIYSLAGFTQSTKSHINDYDSVYIKNVDIEASYPGGMMKFYDYLLKKLKYPKEAKKIKKEGNVIVEFIVEKNGSISNIEIAKGIGSGCDEEVLRLIASMPDWEPAQKNGNPVRQKIRQYVLFKFQ